MSRFIKPNRPITRVFIHCSASDAPEHDNVATMDAWHKQRGWSGVGYNAFCRKSGQGEMGRSLEVTPAAQKGHNRGSIALCLHGLDESKFTDAQKRWLIDICAEINEAYDGKVTFHGHKEVAAKACPVIDYREILQLDEDGRLGVQGSGEPVRWVVPGEMHELEAPEAGDDAPMVLRVGERGLLVDMLQEQLKALGYQVGAVDGVFGTLTRDAVLAFQADNHLVQDGAVGRATREALADAEGRKLSDARAQKSLIALAQDGSRIASASVSQGVTGVGLTAGGALAVVEEHTGLVTELAGQVRVLEGVVGSLGPWVGGAVVVVGALIVLQAFRAGNARVQDHREGKTL